jgi:hypothetical protein
MSRYPAILSVIHHRRNPLDSTRFDVSTLLFLLELIFFKIAFLRKCAALGKVAETVFNLERTACDMQFPKEHM